MQIATYMTRCILSQTLRAPLISSSIQSQKYMDILKRNRADCCDFKNKDKNPKPFKKITLHKDSAKAWADLPPCPDPECPEPCKMRRGKKKGILHEMKLRIIRGGSNFGTPLWRLKCDGSPPPITEVKASVKPKKEESVKKEPPSPTKAKRGIQVVILGAETPTGQYLALLLKQCPFIKMVRLYEAECSTDKCDRDVCKAVQDLMTIDTSCDVQAYTHRCNHLERALQCNDIVVILGSGNQKARGSSTFNQRFEYHAPMMIQYANAISYECPRAFVIVCASPVETNMPLIAEVMRETRWYDPLRLIGSMALPEMRASSLAAKALSLQPCYTRVPCVIGSEGETLIPLFSRVVENFDFSPTQQLCLMQTVRGIPACAARTEVCGLREAELSEAHATASLVTKVAHALLCHDHPRLYAYVDTNYGLDVALSKYMSIEVELNGNGISKYFPLPPMNCTEQCMADHALLKLEQHMALMEEWYSKYLYSCGGKNTVFRNAFFVPKELDHLRDCSYNAAS